MNAKVSPSRPEKPRPSENTDWASNPLRFLLAWGIPIMGLVAAQLLPPTPAILTVSGAFVWMGVGCLINAARCRRHCFLSGPVFLAGGALVALTGFGVLDFGPGGVNYVAWGTLGLFALTFFPEFIWGKYLPPKR